MSTVLICLFYSNLFLITNARHIKIFDYVWYLNSILSQSILLNRWEIYNFTREIKKVVFIYNFHLMHPTESYNNLIYVMIKKNFGNQSPFQSTQFDSIQDSIVSFNKLTGNIDCKKAYNT